MHLKERLNKAIAEQQVSDEIVGLADEADLFHSLKAVYNTDGGKLVVSRLVRDVVSRVNWLSGNYQEASDMRLRTECAAIASLLGVAKLLTKAEENETFLNEQIAQALEE